MNNFLKELKRRNVIKAALGYIAVSWVILQAASIIFPALNVPEPTMRYLIVALILVLPAWLVFAWIYEYTPKGFKKTADVLAGESISPATGRRMHAVIIGGMFLAIVLLLTDRIFNITGSMSDTGAVLSIAVLPFENAGSEEDAYFAAGISEDILTQLGKIGVLRVLSRFTLKDYDTEGKTPGQIGKELQVAYLLAGSVRRAGEQLRIGCQLINTRDGTETWAQTYDKVLKDVFKIQREVATSIASSLKAELSPEEEARLEKVPTDNLTAYNLYLKGRQEYYRYDPESMERAIGYFKEALELDKNFALAVAGLSEAYAQSVAYFGNRPFLYIDTALIMAERAVEMDEELAETWKALGMVYHIRGNFTGARESYSNALQKNPNHYPSIVNLANILNDEGDIVTAIQMYKKSAVLDPLSTVSYVNLSNTYRSLGLFEQSLAYAKKVIQLEPDDRWGYYSAANTYLLLEDFDKADEEVHKFVSLDEESANTLEWAVSISYIYDKNEASGYLEKALQSKDFDHRIHESLPITQGYLLLEKGQEEEGRKILQESISYYENRLKSRGESSGDKLARASIYGILGEVDSCQTWLERAVEAGYLGYRSLEIDPKFQSVRENERFLELIERLREKVAAMREKVIAQELED